MTSLFSSQLRNIAKFITIKEILESEFIKESASETEYYLSKSQKKIYDINLVGRIVNKDKTGSRTDLLLDDGTATILVCFFEETTKNLLLSQTVLLIAKVREFNKIRYLAPEIIKIVNPQWLLVRSALLRKESKEPLIPDKTTNTKNQSYLTKSNQHKKATIDSEMLPIETGDFPLEKIIGLVRQLDAGEGVPFEELLEKSPFSNTDKMVQELLEKGDLFQNQPGRVKVL